MRDNDADIDEQLGMTFAKVGESPAVLEQGARLQAMIDAHRGEPKPLVDPRSLPVRFTRLKEFARSPAHYLASCQDNFEETLATRIGSGGHAALFENRPVVCYDGRRAGKAWERFERHHLERRAVILNETEYRIAMGIVGAIRRHDRAMAILFDGTTRERKIDWEISGRRCSSTPDAFRDQTHDADLKTARSTEPRWFAREALRRHYHAQLSFYDDAIEYETNHRSAEQYIVGVENVEPFNVTVVRMPDATREIATRIVRAWWERLTIAEATETYGGYVEHDIDLEIPDYDDRAPQVVEVDGKHVFVD